MKKCSNCKLKYPDDCISDMASNVSGKLTYTPLCGVCALKIRNATMGLPPDEPFGGEMANMVYENALFYRQKHYDKN